MNLTRTKAVAWKETLHIIRDPRSLAMAILIPVILILLFGLALTLDVDRVPTVVWDQSRTPASRDFVSLFDGSRYFQVNRYVSSYGEVEEEIEHGRAFAALVIPAEFGRMLTAGRTAAVQIIIDGSDSNTASMVLAYAEAVAQRYSESITLEQIRRGGGAVAAPALEIRPRMWFNPDMESRNYIIPGLIAVIMMVIAALLTSLTIAREWERGTMEQLISTPVKGTELIAGKLAPYFAIGMIDVLIAVLMGEFLFRVPLRGSVVLLFVMAGVFLFGVLMMGMLISILTRNQLLSIQLAMVTTFLPSFLLSGFMFAIENMPRPIQVVTHAIPARYFISILKGIYMKGAGLDTLAPQAILLLLFGVLVSALAVAKFKKKLV